MPTPAQSPHVSQSNSMVSNHSKRSPARTSPTFEVSVVSPPSTTDVLVDRGFRGLAYVFAWLTIVLVCTILYEIGGHAFPAIQEYGLSFVTQSTWDANNAQFSVLPEIWGTLSSSLLALAIATFFGVFIAIFLTQDFLTPRVERVFTTIFELLAAIPSVVYGLWGIYIVIPTIRPIATWLHEHLGTIPFFSTPLSGPGLLPASLVLSIMILPTIAAVSRDAISAVPNQLREAAYGLGATRWQVIPGVVLRTASSGIFGAMVLGLGRALGETMALAMLIGNSNQVSLSLFSPANTLAALLANNFPEAGKVEEQALMFAALILLAITLGVNMIGTVIIDRTTRRLTGGTS